MNGNDEERIDPDRLDRLLFLAERLDAPRRAVGAQDGHRMGLERDREGGPAGLPGPGDDGLEDPAVAEVNAVEVADRADAAAREVGLRGEGRG